MKYDKSHQTLFLSIETINFTSANVFIVHAEATQVLGFFISDSDIADNSTSHSACLDIHLKLWSAW